jgi:hypothetical protein
VFGLNSDINIGRAAEEACEEAHFISVTINIKTKKNSLDLILSQHLPCNRGKPRKKFTEFSSHSKFPEAWW